MPINVVVLLLRPHPHILEQGRQDGVSDGFAEVLAAPLTAVFEHYCGEAVEVDEEGAERVVGHGGVDGVDFF
jgi:hypothetical protein